MVTTLSLDSCPRPFLEKFTKFTFLFTVLTEKVGYLVNVHFTIIGHKCPVYKRLFDHYSEFSSWGRTRKLASNIWISGTYIYTTRRAEVIHLLFSVNWFFRNHIVNVFKRIRHDFQDLLSSGIAEKAQLWFWALSFTNIIWFENVNILNFSDKYKHTYAFFPLDLS